LLSKDLKILKRSDFLRIGKSGATVRTKHFIIRYARNDLLVSRIGVTASKKIGGAVKRNRVKRLVREFFRSNRSRLRNSTDFVFIAGKDSWSLSYDTLRDELLEGLLKKGLCSKFKKIG